MAKQVLGDVIIFDAAEQYEGWAHRNQTTKPVYDVKLYVKDYTIFGGASGGTAHVTDVDSGKDIVPTCETAADLEQNYPYNDWVDGLWVETLDDGLKIQFNCGYY